ncbi:hypothetical protein TUBRATIS_30770 [Tubulinosema ratisbonensis]|uniref:SANT domain-containing protein n=1 Tax=Tubulinosema ratisbonensis TaxID=291195 RepID=A0A437AH91_9MICR|nr:hypothetical protein TUBRATIS_30770 [Tubulinosema ratisbonensis]
MKSVKELIQYYESLKIEERREQEVSSNTNQAEITPEISVEEKKDQVISQQDSTKNVPKEEEKILKPEQNDSLVCYIVEEPRNIEDLINFFDKTESKIGISAEEKNDKAIAQQDSIKNEPKMEDNSHTQDLNDSLVFNIAEKPRNIKDLINIFDKTENKIEISVEAKKDQVISQKDSTKYELKEVENILTQELNDFLVCNIAEEPRSIKDPINFFDNGEGNKESNVDLDQKKKEENDVLTIENSFEKYSKRKINKTPEVEEEKTLPVKDLIDLFEIYGNSRTYSYRYIKRENLFVKFTNVKGLPIKRVLKAGLIRKGYFRSGPRNENCLKPSSLRCIYGMIRCELK